MYVFENLIRLFFASLKNHIIYLEPEIIEIFPLQDDENSKHSIRYRIIDDIRNENNGFYII